MESRVTPDTAVVAAPQRTVATLREADTPIGVELKSTFDLSAADTAAVRELVARRPNVGMFLSKPWMSSFFAEPAGPFQPHVALFREGRALRGVAPIGISDRPRNVRVTLLGGGRASDRTDILAARGYEARCADALLSSIGDSCGKRGFVLELRDVPGDSPLWAAMYRLDGDRHVALAPREVYAGPYLDLRECRSETITQLPSACILAASLDRHRRRLEHRGRLRVEVLRDPGDALAAFDTLVRFLHQRWLGQAAGSSTDDPWKQRLHRRLIPLLIEEGYLRMVRISVDLRTVAVVYAMAAGEWWGCYLVGYDREGAGRIHLGRVALSLAINLATQEGATEFDFLKGAERVKYLWPVRERITVDADVFTRRAGAQFTRAARAGRDVAVGLVNSVRHLVAWR